MNTKELIAEAISLPLETRALVVDTLLRSFNQPEPEVDNQWATIAEKRLTDMKTGIVSPVPGHEVFAKIWKRFEE